MSCSRYLFAVILAATASAHAQQPPQLLLPLTSTGDVRTHEEQTLAQLTKEEGAMNGHLMLLNRAALTHVTAGTVMSVALAPNDTETVRIQSAVTDAAGLEKLAGRMQGTDQTSFLMVVDKDGTAGTVDMGARFFEITSVDANAVAVIEIDRTQLPDEEGDLQLDGDATPSTASAEPGLAAKKATTTPSFRVLVVYTPQAVTDAGGAAALIRQINLGVDQLNTAFQQSGINASATLALVAQVGLAESGTTEERLNALIADPRVKALRVEAKADIVTAITATLPQPGLARVYRGNARSFAPNAYGIVKRSSATNGYSYAHEVGHNLGCTHNSETGETGFFSYSHGFRVFTEKNGQKRKGFRSLMAYHCTNKNDPNDCVRVLYFSNPNVTYDKRKTGSADADNARSVNNTIADVATFFSLLPK